VNGLALPWASYVPYPENPAGLLMTSGNKRSISFFTTP
jgi:hypothetical protein